MEANLIVMDSIQLRASNRYVGLCIRRAVLMSSVSSEWRVWHKESASLPMSQILNFGVVQKFLEMGCLIKIAQPLASLDCPCKSDILSRLRLHW